MYGITKIHSYQIKYYQKEVFEFEQNLNKSVSRKKGDGSNAQNKRNRFDAFEDIECPDIELPQNFFSTQLGEDLHILSEDPYDRLKIVMQDAELLNFGCLKDEELELMYNDSILLDLQKLQISKERDISEKMADVIIAEKVHRQSSQEILSPVLVDISKRKSKSRGKLSLTPQKRQPQQIQSETPTKKRRLSFDTAAVTVQPPALVGDVTVSAPELPAEETGMVVSPQQIEPDMELESLHSSYVVISRHSKKSKIIDQKIALTDDQLRKWRQNVKIHCKQLYKPIEHLTPAINLFKQPSYLPKRWNANLCKLFVDRIMGPFVSVDENIAPAEFVKFQETIREQTISRLNLPTEDLSTFAKTDTVITEHVDSSVNVLPTSIAHVTANVSLSPLPEIIPQAITLEEGISTIEQRQDQDKLPDISNIDESLEDIDILLERQRQSSKSILKSPAISSKTSQPELTNYDILAQLEVFWLKSSYVKFSQLIPKNMYTREDAATVFNILLELHSQNELILQQSECFRTLRIWKKGKLN